MHIEPLRLEEVWKMRIGVHAVAIVAPQRAEDFVGGQRQPHVREYVAELIEAPEEMVGPFEPLFRVAFDRTVQEPVNEDGRPSITLASGKLSVTADTAEKVLITSGVPFFERSNTLVRPIIKTVDLFHGRKTETAQFARVDVTYMRDVLGRVAGWYRLDKRDRQWVAVDPPPEAAATILARVGEWKFPTVIGIATAPTLRPDGTVLDQLGYDPVTRLLLIDTQQMPPIPGEF